MDRGWDGGGEGGDGGGGGRFNLHPTPPQPHCSISDPDWRDEISLVKMKRSRCQNNS